MAASTCCSFRPSFIRRTTSARSQRSACAVCSSTCCTACSPSITGPNSRTALSGRSAAMACSVSAQRTVSRSVRKGVPMLGMESSSAAPPYSTRWPGLHSAMASSVSDGAQNSSMRLSPLPISSRVSKVSVGSCMSSRCSKKPALRLNWISAMRCCSARVSR